MAKRKIYRIVRTIRGELQIASIHYKKEIAERELESNNNFVRWFGGCLWSIEEI